MESTPAVLGQGDVEMPVKEVSQRPSQRLLPSSREADVITQGASAKGFILWRGFRDTTANSDDFKDFLKDGGSELAPSSTTEKAKIAVRYARAPTTGQSLIFRLVFRDFMQHGGNLKFLSAFPHEVEVLYPPLTYFGPKASYTPFKWEDGVEYTIIDVTPHFPGGQ